MLLSTTLLTATLTLTALAAPFPRPHPRALAFLPDISRVRVPVQGHPAEVRSELEEILLETRGVQPTPKKPAKIVRRIGDDEAAAAIHRMSVERCGKDGC